MLRGEKFELFFFKHQSISRHLGLERVKYIIVRQICYNANNIDEAKMHMAEMPLVGFPGCIGNTDATNVVAMDCCVYKLQQSLIQVSSYHIQHAPTISP